MKYKNTLNTTDKFCSLNVIKLGNWLLKISSLGNQIVIIAINIVNDDFSIRIFTDELEACQYLEMFYD